MEKLPTCGRTLRTIVIITLKSNNVAFEMILTESGSSIHHRLGHQRAFVGSFKKVNQEPMS